MSNPWFRMYAEFLHDPKVRVMEEKHQLYLVLLLCLRCNGVVTLQDKHVTFSLRISDSEWQLAKHVFIDSGFIDSDNNVLNWDKRQFVSDSSAARVAKHRSLHKKVTVTPCNVTVTPPEQNRTEQNIIKPLAEFSASFINFWESWPKHFRKGAKSSCWKVWKNRKLDDLGETIVNHVKYCKGNGVWKEEQYIPAPLVYLNGNRWEGAEIKSSSNDYGTFI